MKPIAKLCLVSAVIMSMIGMMISSSTIVQAQNVTAPAPGATNATATEEGGMAMVMSLEDSRTGATYEYTINSLSEAGPILNSVLQAGNPQGAGTQAIGDVNTQAVDEFIADVSSLDDAGVSGLDGEADVSGFFSFLKKGLNIVKKVGPIAIKFAPLLL